MYNPPHFKAKNGTTVTFYFPKYKLYHFGSSAMLIFALCRNSTLHSVTQGFFEKPCEYLAAKDGAPAGFDSGLEPRRKFTLQITNDQKRKLTYCLFFSFVVKRLHATAIFFYCKAPFHCNLGMVG